MATVLAMATEPSGRKQADDYWASKHKDPAFLKQRDEWYAKARESGFDDLEMVDSLTKEPSRHLLKGMSPGDLWRGLYKPDAEEYYTLCRGHVHDIRDRPVDRAIWSLHAEGMSAARIKRCIGARYGLTIGGIKKVIKTENTRMMKLVRRRAKQEAADGGQE